MITKTKTPTYLLSRAQFAISQRAGRPCSLDGLRAAARRVGALHVDENGHGHIPVPVVDEFAQNFATLGVFTRRGQRSIENLEQAV